MKNILIILTMCMPIVNCTSARISKNLSSGAIGCLPKDIKIINETAGIESTHNWEAECKGQRFICSYHPTTGANCTKALSVK